MYLLDTDIINLIFYHQGQQSYLERQLFSTPKESLWISVVTVSELMRGTLAVVKKNEQAGKLAQGYDVLTKLLNNFAKFQILPFDEDAEKIYQAMSAKTKRLGPKDCQIAALAMARDFTVITRNTRDFQRIPKVKFADWTSALP